MKSPLIRIIYREYAALASLALTVGITGGILIQAFSRPEAVMLFAATASILFGALGGGFRRQERKLEFLLSRNIDRTDYYRIRFFVGLFLLLPIVVLVALNLLLPLSGWFWSLFVESGLTYSERLPLGDGFGWALLGLSTSIWGYTASFDLSSRARDASQVLIALVFAIIVFAALPVLCIGCAKMLAVFGFLNRVYIYSPQSIVWIIFQIFVICVSVVVLWTGTRRFEKVDVA